MRSDLAALTPPLVIAVAFIAGVVALLRREMAPRRRGRAKPSPESGAPAGPHGEPGSPGFTQMRGGPQNADGEPASDDNSAGNDRAGFGAQDLPDHAEDGA
jgi:hypothetical protein